MGMSVMSEKTILKEGYTKGNIKPSEDRDRNVRPTSPPPPPKPKNHS
jgi:hypothetical protein